MLRHTVQPASYFRQVVRVEAQHQFLHLILVIVIVCGDVHFDGLKIGHPGMSLLPHHFQVAVQHGQEVYGIDFLTVVPYLHM